MRHGNGYRKLNRTHEHRKAMFANLVCSIIEHEQIKTTVPKAKELKRIIDRIISLGKRGDLHARRIAGARIRQENAVKKLFEVLGPRYKERHGGYSRVIRAGFRYGDMAPMAIIELVDRDLDAKGAADRKRVEAEQANIEPE
ncbi:MAG: 50S ribosomal protein L17 [Pseudomonadota bacterium]|nr:50S ribosomal protein L17 [Pseudomonadota bacterium]